MIKFLSSPKLDADRIVAAIRAAESRTSGEIRVVVSRRRTADPVAAATKIFERFGMTRTAARNGILILVAPRSRKFAVIGDRAVHEKCGQSFWRGLADAMTEHFRRAEFTEGIVHGVGVAGSLLAEHFPGVSGNGNELPDGVEEVD